MPKAPTAGLYAWKGKHPDVCSVVPECNNIAFCSVERTIACFYLLTSFSSFGFAAYYTYWCIMYSGFMPVIMIVYTKVTIHCRRFVTPMVYYPQMPSI